MKTKTYNVYEFDELTDEQKEMALDEYRFINVEDSSWYEYQSDWNAVKIEGFDLDRGQYCDIQFTTSAEDTARYIVENHSKTCDTYKTSTQFLKEMKVLEKQYIQADREYEKELEQNSQDNLLRIEGEMEELRHEYEKQLSEDILVLLRNDYDYLTSDESIIDTFKANEFLFTEKGKID